MASTTSRFKLKCTKNITPFNQVARHDCLQVCENKKYVLPCQGSNLESFAVTNLTFLEEIVGERLAIGPQGIELISVHLK